MTLLNPKINFELLRIPMQWLLFCRISPCGLFPLHLSVLVQEELLHLREERVRLVSAVVFILAEDELDALGWRGDCKEKKVLNIGNFKVNRHGKIK